MASTPVRLTFRIFLGLYLIGWLPTEAAQHGSSASSAQRKSRADNSRVLVTVNGIPITENQVELYRLIHRMKSPLQPETHKKIVDQLVDNELMRPFLAERRAEVETKQVKAAVKAVKEQLRSAKLDPDQTLRSLGINDAALGRELSLPLAWGRHLSRMLTQQVVRQEFDRHRTEYDGTEIRASQIFVKVPANDNGAKAKEAQERLAKIRAEIVAKKISFADAARKYSEAPSNTAGGDVGFFPFRGKMPTEVCRVAFALKTGEISQPFHTPFGFHLYTVTEVRPGNLSLEDIRYLVIRRVAQELWDKLVAEARKKAKIEWAEPAP